MVKHTYLFFSVDTYIYIYIWKLNKLGNLQDIGDDGELSE